MFTVRIGKISNQKIMKKLILIVAVITVFAFISCKKDRTCQCTTTVSTDTSSFTFSSEIIYEHSTKRNAKSNCQNSYSFINGVTTITECKLILYR